MRESGKQLHYLGNHFIFEREKGKKKKKERQRERRPGTPESSKSQLTKFTIKAFIKWSLKFYHNL